MSNLLLKILAVTVLFTFNIGRSMAQVIKALSLKEAIELSLKNSKQLKASKARIDEATASLNQAMDNRLPNFTISGSYLRIAQPHIVLNTKSGGNPGGGDSTSTPSVNQAAYGIANVSYPLFSGGRIKYGIESARYLQTAANLDADNDKEAVILNTIDAYTNLYKSRAAIEVVKENLQSSQHRDSNFSRLEQNGLLARNDLLKAELQTSNIELSLLDAENNSKLANVNMNLILGLPESTELMPDSASFKEVIQIKNLEDFEKLATQNRKDMQALNYRKKASDISFRSAKTEGYPTVALTGGYVAAYIPNFITITNAINVGVGVQYNLASLWRTNTKLQQVKAQQQELQANIEQLDDAVRLQINRDYQNYLLNTKKIDVYTKAEYQATDNYRITKNKYDNNLVTLTDLLDADVAQLQTRLNLVFSRVDAVSAYNKLLQTAGLLSNYTADINK